MLVVTVGLVIMMTSTLYNLHNIRWIAIAALLAGFAIIWWALVAKVTRNSTVIECHSISQKEVCIVEKECHNMMLDFSSSPDRYSVQIVEGVQ
jgi:hypothetical protein